ncbi:MAG: hypothetical protein AMXMBFR64_52710 [Myxococcales bacterium]
MNRAWLVLGPALALLSSMPEGLAQPAPSAAPALRAWLDALERGDADAAWELLAPEARLAHTLPSFREAVQAGRGDLIRKARAWVDAAEGASVRATVTVGRLEVELEPSAEGWRLTRWPEGAGAGGAEAARSAARLARARLLDGLGLTLAPDARAALARRLEEAAGALDALAAGGEPTGDVMEATLRDGAVVRLVRRDDGWWLADLRWLAP